MSHAVHQLEQELRGVEKSDQTGHDDADVLSDVGIVLFNHLLLDLG